MGKESIEQKMLATSDKLINGNFFNNIKTQKKMKMIKRLFLFASLLGFSACSSNTESQKTSPETEAKDSICAQTQNNLFFETYDFSINETYDKIGYEGFSVPEISAGGIWTDSSVVSLSLPHIPNAYSTILFDVFPAVNEKNPTITVDIYLRDSNEKLETWIFKMNESSKPAILVKKGDEPSDVLSLKLVIKDAKSPAELGTGSDTRKLGLFFEKITVFGFKE